MIFNSLFFGVSIATCILILRKNKPENKTLFINASEIFTKATNKNKLSDENITQILALYTARKDSPHLVALVDNATILSDSECNLSVSIFVEAKDTREAIDIDKLNAEISQIVARQSELRKSIDEIVKNLQ